MLFDKIKPRPKRLNNCIFCSCTVEMTDNSICKKCLTKWNDEIVRYSEKAKRIRKPRGVESCTFLSAYVKGTRSMCNRLIIRLKDDDFPAGVNFITWQLAEKIASAEWFSPHECVIVNIPRSKKGVILHGFDQAQLLAIKLAERLNIKYVPAILHVGRYVEQKALKGTERLKNASLSYKINKRTISDFALNRCILVDDITTSGSTLSVCARLLKRYGARSVEAAVTARTLTPVYNISYLNRTVPNKEKIPILYK